MATWGQIGTAAATGGVRAPAPVKKAAAKPATSWSNVGRAAVSGGVRAPAKPAPTTTWGDVGMAGIAGGAGSAVSPETYAIMRQSGSNDPTDPYNWKGIAAALSAGSGAPAADSFSSGGDFGGGSSYTAPAPAPAAPTPVMQAPSAFNASPVNQAPSVVGTAAGMAGAPTGASFQSSGRSGTFGNFDRLRNQRTPKQGLSVTPEMLRRQAASRLGG